METKFIKSTRIYKGRDGWCAESMSQTDVNGKAWQISTWKVSGGVACTAVEGQDEGPGMFSFEMFGAKRLKLASQAGQCNENRVKEVHAAGVAEFERLMQEQAPVKPAYVVGVGQIIFTDGGGYDDRKRVIYEVVRPGKYKTVTIDGKQLFTDDHLKPYSEKFGIGDYYNEGETMPQEEVFKLVESATKHQAEEMAKEQEAERIAAEDRAAKIEKGREIIPVIPSGAVAVIVAEKRKDTSEPMNDYHGHDTKEKIYLSWSSHKRDLFPEMRKAAGKFEHTKVYEVAPVKPEDAGQYWEAEDEHREKYSMGEGYYLGKSKYSGWIVEKQRCDLSNPKFLETLQIAAAEGRFLCGEFEKEPEAVNIAPVEVSPGKIQIIDYSEKAVAVVGDTKCRREKLKELGGRFNPHLSVGPGWIFSKKRLDELKEALTN